MKPRLILPLLLLIGLGMRLSYWHGTSDSPEFRVPVLDARWYHDRAEAWAAGSPGSEQDLFRAPGYPFLLGQLYKIFGSGPYTVRIFQMLLGLGAMLLLRAIGDRIFGPPTGLVAAALLLFYYPFVYFESETLATTTYLFLLLLTTRLLLRAGSGEGIQWLLAGIALGVAAVVRPTALSLAPFLPLWAWRHERRALPAILLLTGIAIPPAGVATANRIAYGKFQLASQGGVNLYIGNNPAADGKTAAVPGWQDAAYETKRYEDVVSLAARRIAERERGGPLTPAEVSRFWLGRTAAWARSSPGDAAGLLARKVYYLLNRVEIPNNRLLGPYVREEAPWLYYATPGAGVLIALGAAGIFVGGGARRGRDLLILMLALLAAGVVLFFVCSRFRVPLMPYWILFAAWLLVRLARERRRFPFGRAAAVALPLLLLAHTGWAGVGEVRDLAQMFFSRGFAYAEEGRLAEAETWYRKALAEEPGNPRILVNLGTLLAERGEGEEAERVLREALDRDPGYAPFVWNNLALARSMAGDDEGAARFFERALAADSGDADVYANLGNALLSLGRPEEALVRYDEALRRGTERVAPVRLGRAVALVRSGMIDEGVLEAATVARALPGVPEAWAVLAELAAAAGRDDLAEEAAGRFRMRMGRAPGPGDLPPWAREGR
ncbi:MAG: tetratricopeptide repeat protein [Candidatus Eisenbacteria bacterium]